MIPLHPSLPTVRLLQNRIALRILPPQILETFLEIVQFASPRQTQSDDHNRQRDCCCPVHPLTERHITNIRCVHTHDTSDSTERKENDGDDGEGVDRGFLPVLVGVDFLNVLPLKSACLSHNSHVHDVHVVYTHSPSSEAISRISLKSLMRLSTNARLSWIMMLCTPPESAGSTWRPLRPG